MICYISSPILCAGHSLGGALATLAAIDLQKKYHFPDLHVYTYGTPRTGSAAFYFEALSPAPRSMSHNRSQPLNPKTLNPKP